MWTRSAILMRPSSRESCLMLSRWNWMRSDQGCEAAGSRRCLILSLQTSRASTLCGVSVISFSHRCEPMNPPAPIMHIVIAFIGFPSRSTLAAAISEISLLSSLSVAALSQQAGGGVLNCCSGGEMRGANRFLGIQLGREYEGGVGLIYSRIGGGKGREEDVSSSRCDPSGSLGGSRF